MMVLFFPQLPISGDELDGMKIQVIPAEQFSNWPNWPDQEHVPYFLHLTPPPYLSPSWLPASSSPPSLSSSCATSPSSAPSRPPTRDSTPLHRGKAYYDCKSFKLLPFFRSFALTVCDNSSSDFERRRKEQGLTLLVSSCILLSDFISLVCQPKKSLHLVLVQDWNAFQIAYDC